MKPITLSFNDLETFKQQVKAFAFDNEGQGFLYKLYCEKDNMRIPVHRVAGEDLEGILYMGQTKSLYDRMSLLCKSFYGAPANGKLWKHGADEIYWQCDAVREKYPVKNMFVEILSCADSKKSEYDAISSYCKKYGEVPPFNGAIVKEKK